MIMILITLLKTSAGPCGVSNRYTLKPSSSSGSVRTRWPQAA